jgi:saccharopine dehydrogenase (NADP+, L-glutamate forming)/spermidine synthase
MADILILGAGLVAKPLVRYLLSQDDFHVTVASRTVSKAEKLIGSHPRANALELNLKRIEALDSLVPEADVVISLVPYAHHVAVAEYCMKYRTHMVTTSYVSERMKALHRDARDAGVLILNEIGLDPGIDHMSAMHIIHSIQERGGTVAHFYSYCGGLPAPEANTNPLGYKFSWSPRGVILAGTNSAQFLEKGMIRKITPDRLFSTTHQITIREIGTLEVYPNRDSIQYIDLYGLSGIQSIFRGTLRNPGWCETWQKFVDLGLLEDRTTHNLKNLTMKDYIRTFFDGPNTGNMRKDIAAHLNLPEDSHVLDKFEWLGFFGSDPMPIDEGSGIDFLEAHLLEKLPYKAGERDMIVLHHRFLSKYPDKDSVEEITSTLVDFGIPEGDSSMSRTVGLPAAIAARLIAEGKITVKGVHIPVLPEIYEPVLKELETQNIRFEETRRDVEDGGS